MDAPLYWFARAVAALIQALPLTLVARLGRACGAAAFWLDARHRRVALRNLEMCFGGEKSPAEIRAIAKENFRRIGENYRLRRQNRLDDSGANAAAFCLHRRGENPAARGQRRPAKPHRGHRPFRQLRALRPLRPVRADFQMRHHLSRAEPAGAQPPDAIAARTLRMPLLRAAHRGQLLRAP